MTIIDRLSNKLIKTDSGCWEFIGSRDDKGYGLIGFNGLVIRTHRVVWILENGPIPNGFMILHCCDNPPCCNPSHLFLGTAQDNSDDMIAKGRRVTLIGARNGNARLTNENVKEIRVALSQGATCNQLGSQFGVHPNTIDAIKHNRTWRHLP